LGDIALPWIRGRFDHAEQGSTFKTLRLASPERRQTYLVTHLGGETLEISLGLVDKALYAERYLQNFAGRPSHPYYGRVWLDHNGGTGARPPPPPPPPPPRVQGLIENSPFSPAPNAQPSAPAPPRSPPPAPTLP